MIRVQICDSRAAPPIRSSASAPVIEEVKFARDSALEEAERTRVSAGSLQGNSSIRSSVARQRGPKRISNQCLTSQFPTHPNREFFEALRGIKSDD